jgi:aspartate carbamoyltransferase catalytic subunit
MDLISIRDIDKKTIEQILDLAAEKEKSDAKTHELKKSNRVLATLFFEPSTRTKLSFQTAAVRNGLDYIDFIIETSSVKKGESFVDTIKTISGYADVLVVRHPKEGSARLAAAVSGKPVVNGGDGGNQHPTQTLIDLYTMRKHKGKIAGLNVALAGDLKHARTMHSLLYALGMFGANVKLMSPKGLEMDKETIDEVKKKFDAKIEFKSEFDVNGIDVLYVCRIQAERFADPLEAKRVQEQFYISMENLKGAKSDMIIMHPLPKVNEIAPEIDNSKHAKYFEQAHYGVPVRMAVLEYVLSH